MKEFFGFGGYTRKPEGYMSWQHLVFVSTIILIMIALAIIIGIKNRNKEEKEKNKVLIIAAILIDSFELFKIILLCFRTHDALNWLYDLPLFLCSIQLITIPLAAFSKGRIKEAALDFVMIFGILGAILGTYGAGNNYASYPVLSFDNVISAITHSISGFVSLYIPIVKLNSMKKENIYITFLIIISFCIVAYIVDIILPYNYMFLIRSDGTPYELVYKLVNGSKVLYPLLVVLLFIIYIIIYYNIYYLIGKTKHKKIEK